MYQMSVVRVRITAQDWSNRAIAMSAVEPPKDVTGGKGHFKGKSKEAFKGKLLQLKGKAKGIKGLTGTGKGKTDPAATKGEGNGGTDGAQPPAPPNPVVESPVPSPANTTADSETSGPPATPVEETPPPHDAKGLPGGSGEDSKQGGGEMAAIETPPLKRPLISGLIQIWGFGVFEALQHFNNTPSILSDCLKLCFPQDAGPSGDSRPLKKWCSAPFYNKVYCFKHKFPMAIHHRILIIWIWILGHLHHK